MRRLLSTALCGTAIAAASPALAQDRIDVAPVIADACRSRPVPEATQGMLALAVLRHSGHLGIDQTIAPADAPGLVFRIVGGKADSSKGPQVKRLVRQLQGELSDKGSDPDVLGLALEPRGSGSSGNWLFAGPLALSCVHAEEKDEKAPSEALRLRGSVDDLMATGKDRRGAGSATIGYARQRSNESGTVKTSTTTTLKGVLGYAFPASETAGLIAFAGYDLKRTRTDPAPVLAPGVSQRDSDTDVIQLGLKGYIVPRVAGGRVLIEANGTLILDQVKDSRRGRFDVALTPSIRTPRSLRKVCAIGAFNEASFIPGLRTRCGFSLSWQVSHFFEKGTATIGPANELVFGGGKLTLDIAPAGGSGLIPDKSGLIAGVNYQYQQRLHGTGPSIDRFSAYVKYRYWINPTFGVDFGFDFTDGTNTETFADENKLQFSVGLIF